MLGGSSLNGLTAASDHIKLTIKEVIVACFIDLAHGAVALAQVLDLLVEVLRRGFHHIERNLDSLAHFKIQLWSKTHVKLKGMRVRAEVNAARNGQGLAQNFNFFALEVGIKLILKAFVNLVSRNGLLVLLAY